MSNLQPTPIVDKNGRATTVHRKNGSAPTTGRVAGIPVRTGTSTENEERLEKLYDYTVSFATEFDNRVKDVAGDDADEEHLAAIAESLSDDENLHARTVQKIAEEVEDAFHSASDEFANPDDLVDHMYSVLNGEFDKNRDVISDDPSESYRKKINREFILDVTLVLSGSEPVMHSSASEI